MKSVSTGWNDVPELDVQHLTMRFGGLVAIGDLSFKARRKEITALIGPNGAGKTTVFNCITGFYKPTEGMLKMTHADGKEFMLERMDDFRVNQEAKVARTFQNIRLFGGMTVLENLLVAQHNKLMGASGFTLGALFNSAKYTSASKEAVEKAKHWLEKVNLVDRADDPAADLPYGAQRRLEIARALCTGPRLLCLDEPAAGLNPRESEELNQFLKSVRDEEGIAILLIEHDMSVVMGISDHVVVLDYGRKISDGTPAQVKADPAVIRAYLGVEEDDAGAPVPAAPAPTKIAAAPAPLRATVAAALAPAAPVVSTPLRPTPPSPEPKRVLAHERREEIPRRVDAAPVLQSERRIVTELRTGTDRRTPTGPRIVETVRSNSSVATSSRLVGTKPTVKASVPAPAAKVSAPIARETVVATPVRTIAKTTVAKTKSVKKSKTKTPPKKGGKK